MNQTALVVIDSRCVAERRRAETTIFAALDHFGVPWNVYELGAHEVASDFAEDAPRDPMAPPGPREFIDRYVGDRALFILAHDGAGCMPSPMARRIAEAVRAGAGLVSFDRQITEWPAPLRDWAAIKTPSLRAEKLFFDDKANPFLILPHEPGEELRLNNAIGFVSDNTEGAAPILRGSNGNAAVWTRSIGDGRAVFFGCGAGLFDETVLGHGNRITGLMWRALIWAARKPFAARSIPPFITARFDDCTGSYDAFGYVQALNAAGIRPNLGLFVDELSASDWQAAGALSRCAGADFSIHAFRDDLLKHSPGWQACRSMAHKPQFAEGAYKALTMDHFTGAEFDDAALRRGFAICDQKFTEHGLRHSRIINSHFAEVAFRALPRFFERGADILVNGCVAGQLYGNQPVWRPRPFAIRGDSGYHPLIIDAAPDQSGAFCACVSAPTDATARMEGDILWGHTPFIGECARVDIASAVARCIGNMEWALDAMAWGMLTAHEQRVACVPPEDWQRLVAGITRHFSGRDVQFAGREDVALATKRLFASRLVRARFENGVLQCELTGQTDGPSPLTVWSNDGQACRRVVHQIEQIKTFRQVVIPI